MGPGYRPYDIGGEEGAFFSLRYRLVVMVVGGCCGSIICSGPEVYVPYRSRMVYSGPRPDLFVVT